MISLVTGVCHNYYIGDIGHPPRHACDQPYEVVPVVMSTWPPFPQKLATALKNNTCTLHSAMFDYK